MRTLIKPALTARYSYCLLVLLSLAASPCALAQDARPVSTIRPVVTATHETLSLSGSLTAEKSAKLSTKVDGLVTHVYVDAGSHVTQGQKLLTLDNAIAKLALEQAIAASAEAKASRDEAARLVTEAERLRKQFHISESELANRRSNLALQQAALMATHAAENMAREQLAQHQLFAPFAGVISNKLTEVGEWISRGNTVLDLVNTNVVRVDVKIPQERFADIQLNTPVTVIADVLPHQPLTGKISAIVPVSDPQARAFLVRILIDSQKFKLLPGTSATALFALQTNDKQLLLIPRDALLLHPDGGYSVFVVKDGKAHRQQIEVGQFSDQGVIVKKGLAAEDEVVVRGNEMLREQQAVHVVQP